MEDPPKINTGRDSLRKKYKSSDDTLYKRLRALKKPNFREHTIHSVSQKARTVSTTGYAKIKQEIYDGLVEVLNPQAVSSASIEQVRSAIDEYTQSILTDQDIPLSAADNIQLIDDLLYEILGLGPLTPLMTDPNVSDILVNGPYMVYVERKGRLESTDIKFIDEDHLMRSIERILSGSGRRVDESRPMADARLPDGSRVNVIIPPLSVHGATISIRRFAVKQFNLDSLVTAGALNYEAATFLKLAVEGRLNIIVSGGTGSGKTTFLNAIAENISAAERIITIEDTAELKLPHEHLVSLEARPENVEGEGEITIRQLVRNALRMRPDRIIVGESRGSEALDMMQAMNTGHEGSMTTVHSNSPRDTLSRMETMMLMADVDLPQRVLREQISSAMQLIIHLARLRDGSRKVMRITEISGLDNGVILTQDLFVTNRNDSGSMVMQATGTVPNFLDFLYQNDVIVDESLFKPK